MSYLTQQIPLYETTQQISIQWIYVVGRFSSFLNNISLTNKQLDDANIKIKNVVTSLNSHYWNIRSDSMNSMLVGSWGKGTYVRPPRDIDILFLLPHDVYHRFSSRNGNIQSQLLQEVKDVLFLRYSRTSIRGDGQVVVIPFNSFKIEVIPAFLSLNDEVIICDSNNGGRYKQINPVTEITAIDYSNYFSNGDTKNLIRMLKHWQNTQNVPLKSFCLELLTMEFIETWKYKGMGLFWYDWMIRDFFNFLQTKANAHYTIGMNEYVFLGNEWLTKAKKAYNSAVQACEYERNNDYYLAHKHWYDIFG